MHVSQSMHLPRRPDIEAFLADCQNDYTQAPPTFNIGSDLEDNITEEEEEDDEEDEEDVRKTEEVKI